MPANAAKKAPTPAVKHRNQSPALAKSTQPTSTTVTGLPQQALTQLDQLGSQTIKKLQRTVGNRAVVQLLAAATPAQPVIQEKEAPAADGLPGSLKAGVENLSGLAMDDVQVHYNSSEPAALQALAFTEGTNIHMAPGQEEHLPHEAWHVVQQKQGRVAADIQEQGVGINTDAGLETEADRMGAQASHLSPAAEASSPSPENHSHLQLSRAAQLSHVTHQRAVPGTPVRQYLFGWARKLFAKMKAKFSRRRRAPQPEGEEPNPQPKTPEEQFFERWLINLTATAEEFMDDITNVSGWLEVDAGDLIRMGMQASGGGWEEFRNACAEPHKVPVNQSSYLNVINGMFSDQFGGDVGKFGNTQGSELRQEMLPPELKVGLEGKEGQAKLDALFDNFNEIAFTYTPQKALAPLGGYMSRTGDCSTLANMFIVAAQEVGLTGVKLVGEKVSRLVDAARVHGGPTNNEMSGQYWSFGEHWWADYNGLKYDLLFMEKDTAIPTTYLTTGGGEYKKIGYELYAGGQAFISIYGLEKLGVNAGNKQGIAFESENAAQAYIDNPPQIVTQNH